jgi:hypothetical protein
VVDAFAESVEWISPTVRGVPPSPRWGHSANIIMPGTLLVLGGREGSKPLPLDHCHVAVIIGSEISWHERTILSGPPKNRYIHATLMLESERRLLLFGGHGGRSRYYNDVHLLDLSDAAASLPSLPSESRERLPSSVSLLRPGDGHDPSTPVPRQASNRDLRPDVSPGSLSDPDAASSSPPIGRWISPTISGSVPPKRSGHSLVRCGARAIVFGGFNGKELLNDVYSLDLTTFVWIHVKITGPVKLPPSHGHCAVSIPGTHTVRPSPSSPCARGSLMRCGVPCVAFRC